MIQIKCRFTGNLICEEALGNIRQLAENNKNNLQGADLRGANLQGADLREADLQGANLQGADLREADLQGADLQGADLRVADNCEKKVKKFKSTIGIGYSRRELQCFMLEDDSFYFNVGCFSGREEELAKKVKEKYGDDCEYMEAIEFLKSLCRKYQNGNLK